MMPMRRVLITVVALIAVAGSLLTIAVLTEHGAGVRARSPLLGLHGVERALRARSLEVSPTGETVFYPGLNVPGHQLQVNEASMTVFVFPSVAERVKADQTLVNQRALFEAEHRVGSVDAPRFVTARNVLLMYVTDDPVLVGAIYRAAVDLSRDDM
jgi:hypothetical protein